MIHLVLLVRHEGPPAKRRVVRKGKVGDCTPRPIVDPEGQAAASVCCACDEGAVATSEGDPRGRLAGVVDEHVRAVAVGVALWRRLEVRDAAVLGAAEAVQPTVKGAQAPRAGRLEIADADEDHPHVQPRPAYPHGPRELAVEGLGTHNGDQRVAFSAVELSTYVHAGKGSHAVGLHFYMYRERPMPLLLLLRRKLRL